MFLFFKDKNAQGNVSPQLSSEKGGINNEINNKMRALLAGKHEKRVRQNMDGAPFVVSELTKWYFVILYLLYTNNLNILFRSIKPDTSSQYFVPSFPDCTAIVRLLSSAIYSYLYFIRFRNIC